MAGSPSFELAATQLERRTDFDRLEARGTLRLALRAVLFDARTIDARQMAQVIERVLPDELSTRGVENATSVCTELAVAVRALQGSGDDVQSPDAIFNRLVRR